MRHNNDTVLCDITSNKRSFSMTMGIFLLAVIFFALSFTVPCSAAEGKNDKTGGLYAEKEKSSDRLNENTENNKKEEVTPGLIEKEYTDKDFAPQVDDESYVWMVFKTILIMGSLVAIFYYFFRFINKKTGIQFYGENVMEILSVSPLGQNKYIQIVDLAGKILVIGVSDNNINLITEITDKDQIDRIRLLGSGNTPEKASSFQDFFMKNIGRVVSRINQKNIIHTKKMPKEDVDLAYLKRQKGRLKNLNGDN